MSRLGDSVRATVTPAGLRRDLRVALVVLFAGPLLALAAWLFLLRMPRSAAVPLVAAGLVALGVRLPGRARVAAWIALAAVAALAWRTPLRELRATLDRLRDAKDRLGAAGLDLPDALGVYGLNVAIGVGGFLVGFPEAAQEALLLCIPGPAIRRWESDFAMRSPKVRATVARLTAAATRSGRDSRELLTARVAWTGYASTDDSMRVALALNSPLELLARARREGGRWQVDLTGRARAQYPRRALLALGWVDGRRIILDEGLFWALQERGWFHPYTAEWRWSIASDDPRLADLGTADLSWRERLLSAALRAR